MKLILAILITCAGCLAAGGQRFDFDSQVGVVDANAEGRLCLNILNSHLADGAELSFILTDKPQRVIKANVEGKADADCSRNPGASDPNTSFYRIKLAGDKRALKQGEPLPPAIAVVGSAGAVSIKHGVASGDLDGDGRAEYFRLCTSTEGNHLTVWTGRPLLGKRRWHFYYYLGYDVVPNCRKKDYQ